MARPLRIYSAEPILGGRETGGQRGRVQARCLIAAASRAEAARAFGYTTHEARTWIQEGSNDAEEALALQRPYVALWRPLDAPYARRLVYVPFGQPWTPEEGS